VGVSAAEAVSTASSFSVNLRSSQETSPVSTLYSSVRKEVWPSA
jgi:hypothetical protein